MQQEHFWGSFWTWNVFEKHHYSSEYLSFVSIDFVRIVFWTFLKLFNIFKRLTPIVLLYSILITLFSIITKIIFSISQVTNLEIQLDQEAKERQQLNKLLRKSEKRVKEITITIEEERSHTENYKNQVRYQPLFVLHKQLIFGIRTFISDLRKIIGNL